MVQSERRPSLGQNGNGGKRAPGRPRSEESRQAILHSTLKLLTVTGFPQLSIEAIAADADVSKATVYRWWPTKAALVADAFSESASEELRFPDTGSVQKDLTLQMRQVIRVFRSQRGKVVAALLGGGQSDPELTAAFRDRFLWPRRRQAYQTLQRGIDRGELPARLDMDLMLDSLYGPIYMRFLIRHGNLDENFADELCGLVVSGVQRHLAKRAAPGRPPGSLLSFGHKKTKAPPPTPARVIGTLVERPSPRPARFLPRFVPKLRG